MHLKPIIAAVVAMCALLVLPETAAAAADPVNQAITLGDTAALSRLIADGAALNGDDPDSAPVVLAAGLGDTGALRLLLDSGAKPLPDAAWAAAREGRREALTLLLDRGVPVNSADPYDMTPLMLASLHGHAGIVSDLLARGAKVDAREVVYGYTALILAAAHGYAGIVEQLAEHGADPNARTVDDKTDLSWAVAKSGTNPEYQPVISLLKRYGAGE